MVNDAAFIADATVTESVPGEIVFTSNDIASLVALQLMTEVADQLKKHIFYGRALNEDKIKELKKQVRNLLDESESIEVTSTSITLDEHVRICHSIIGLNTESGELLNVLNDIVEKGTYDRINFLEEMGDCQWYTGTALDATNSTYQTLFDLVIAKLKKRYPNGKFESDRAINRDVEVEYTEMGKHA